MRQRVSTSYLLSLSALILLLLAALSGCSSAPANAPSAKDSVSVTLMDSEQIVRQYGMTKSENPFLEPKGLRGQPYDFIVLQLATNFSGATKVELEISAKDPAGKNVASLWSKEDFIDLWRSFLENENNMQKREAVIQDYMVPGEMFTAPRGRSTFIIPLMADHPLPKPVDVNVRILYGLEEYNFKASVK